MFRTSLILIFTIVIVPLFAWKFGQPLSPLQNETLQTLIYTCLGISLACFIIAELAKNYSQTDKLWSITPIIYSWIAVWYSDWNTRMIYLAILVTIWGVRLTYNFGRRGGYSFKFWTGEEDYRWAILQEKAPFDKKWVFSLFNLFFISLYQHFLILLFTLPILLSLEVQEIGLFDILLGVIMIGLVYIEWVADEQQFTYQTEKHRKINNKEPLKDIYAKGFTHTGLWGKVRHPNYAAEQSIWIVFYAFSVLDTGSILNWSIIGALLLVILFKSSSDFSEEISAKKYPEYANYQASVGRFLPKLNSNS
jgi:steroid 5-alpha reductase family enzyme